MRRTILILLFCVPFLSLGQTDSLSINSERSEDSYLNRVLINQKSDIGIFEIHFTKGRLSNSYYYAIDLKKNEILSTFNFKNWTYLYSSWIDDDKILHLSKGIFNRKILIDLSTGFKLTSDKKRRKEQAPKDGNHSLHIDSQELYCTNNVVYYEEKRIRYDSNNQCFILDTINW